MGLSNAEKQAAFIARKKQQGLRQFKVWLSEETVQSVEGCYPGQKRLVTLANAIMESVQHHNVSIAIPTPDNHLADDIKACVEKWREQVTENRQNSPRWENTHRLLSELEKILKSVK